MNDFGLISTKLGLFAETKKELEQAIVRKTYRIRMASNPPILIITARAADKIREVIQGQNVPEGYCLRVGVRGGVTGCSGVSYLLGFDLPKEEDMLEHVDGIPVIIDRKQSMHVMGMEIDWHEDETQQGFVFNNPSKRAED